MAKHKKHNVKFRRFIIVVLLITLVVSIILLIHNKRTELNDTETQIEISHTLDTIKVSESDISDTVTKRMLQVRELQKENSDIVGWIEIEGTNINYPVLQGADNDYYLDHDYKGNTVIGGSLFLDKDYNFNIPSSNLLIYGHRNTQGLMFEDLVKYESEDFYNQHKIIRFTTAYDDSKYEILSAFKSRVYYQNETNVFRYYFFVNANNETEYNEFVKNSKQASLYETNVTAEYGEQLMTLSTCEYSQENGRFAVVAKKIK